MEDPTTIRTIYDELVEEVGYPNWDGCQRCAEGHHVDKGEGNCLCCSTLLPESGRERALAGDVDA
jgi:hypothetical protein